MRLMVKEMAEETNRVQVRRQWNDWRDAKVSIDALSGLHWGTVSGGVKVRAPQPFLYGYVSCADIEGDIAHSCAHGEGPHRIRVCIVKKSNTPAVWKKLLEIAGPKPERERH